MPSNAVNEHTRQEWRELGFYYAKDDVAKEWRIVGCRYGLGAFARVLRAYAATISSDALSEHWHVGPYMYLEIGAWPTAEITDHWIGGSLKDLLKLSFWVDERIANAEAGDQLKLREIYALQSPYELIMDVRQTGFDPAREDSLCW